MHARPCKHIVMRDLENTYETRRATLINSIDMGYNQL
jgi:hypothetical protein